VLYEGGDKDAQPLLTTQKQIRCLYGVYTMLLAVNLKIIMNTNEMTLDEKKEVLYAWIRDLDEEVLDQLIIEYLGGE
jgi:hypothetical protein